MQMDERIQAVDEIAQRNKAILKWAVETSRRHAKELRMYLTAAASDGVPLLSPEQLEACGVPRFWNGLPDILTAILTPPTEGGGEHGK